MTAFHYTGRDESGRFVNGTVVAPSRLDAMALLRVAATTPTSVQPAHSIVGHLGAMLGRFSPGDGARLVIFRSLAALVGAGVPLRRSLEIVTRECSNGRLRHALAGVAAEIEQGSTLETAFARRPGEFPAGICAMVRSGEIGGTLDEALRRIATYLERSHALRKKMSGALIYPVVVTGMAMGLVAFLLGAVVPSFSTMFAGMDVQLPPITRFVLAIGNAIDNPWADVAVLLGSAAVAVVARGVARAERFALIWDRVRLRVPVLGSLARRAEVAACARTLGSLANAGVPIETALRAAQTGSTSPTMRGSLGKAIETVRLGESLAGAFAQSDIFGSMFVALARAGEESGTLGDMLVRVADYEELEAEAAVNALGSALEPLLISLVGGMVGTIVAAVLIPLYSMIGNIK